MSPSWLERQASVNTSSPAGTMKLHVAFPFWSLAWSVLRCRRVWRLWNTQCLNTLQVKPDGIKQVGFVGEMLRQKHKPQAGAGDGGVSCPLTIITRSWAGSWWLVDTRAVQGASNHTLLLFSLVTILYCQTTLSAAANGVLGRHYQDPISALPTTRCGDS